MHISVRVYITAYIYYKRPYIYGSKKKKNRKNEHSEKTIGKVKRKSGKERKSTYAKVLYIAAINM